MLLRVWGCEPLLGRERGQGQGQQGRERAAAAAGSNTPSLLMGESPLPLQY